MTLQEMGITEPCPTCKGTTTMDRFDAVSGQPIKLPCADCYKTGEKPSQLGEELLRFLARWKRVL